MVADPGRRASLAARASTAGSTSKSLPSRSTTRGSATPGRSSCATGRNAATPLHFRFNAWGEKYTPYDRRRGRSARASPCSSVCRCTKCRWCSKAVRSRVDGAGTLVTTERCLLNPNRNPGCDRSAIEARARATRSVSSGSSGSPTASPRTTRPTATSTTSSRSRAPGRALLQGCDDSDEPEPRDRARQRARLEAAGIDGRRDPDAAVRAASTARRCRCRT